MNIFCALGIHNFTEWEVTEYPYVVKLYKRSCKDHCGEWDMIETHLSENNVWEPVKFSDKIRLLFMHKI